MKITVSLQRDISEIGFIEIVVHLQYVCDKILIKYFNILTKILEYPKCIKSGIINIIIFS